MKSSNREPLSSPECTSATTHHIHHGTTSTNTSDRSVCRFRDMCRSARCPRCHPNHNGTTRQPQREAGSNMRQPRQRILAAVSARRRKKSAKFGGTHTTKQLGTGPPHTRHGDEPQQDSQQCTGGPWGASTAPITKCGARQASHRQTRPPLPLRGARELHKGGGCAPHAGRCPPRGWQQGCDQPTARGTINVIGRCGICVRGDRRVRQEWVLKRGTQERQQAGGGGTQTQVAGATPGGTRASTADKEEGLSKAGEANRTGN